MKAEDYRGWLERRELTHEAAGRALGVHKSTIEALRRWVDKDPAVD